MSFANTKATVYNDKVVRQFAIMTVVWGVVGMLVGVIIAAQLTWPELNLGIPWLSYGRLRPLHTNAVIFAFGGCGLFATAYYVVQRTCQVRLFGDGLAAFTFWGWQLVIVAAAISLPLGYTQGKEYAELEWPIDILIALVWVAFAVVFFGTVGTRRVKHIYVANWFYGAFIIAVALLHIVNSAALPVGGFTSYSAYAGVQDAMVQWWYGHNAVAFFLTAGFLGMLYYFLPVRSGRPIWSYRLSILSFWGITFFYIWVGSHHLHYTALPYWAQTLGMTFSVMLLVPSWASAGNAIVTLNGAWHKVRDDATLRFMFVAAVFYGLSTFEGSFLAIRPVNSLSHYTDWTVGHVHSGTLGWVAMIVFGAIYTLVPQLNGKTEMASLRAVEWHFWLAVTGTLVYVVSMWNAGITQGLMWRAYDENGALSYSFVQSVEAMAPYYLLRTIGGGLFLIGAAVCAWNCRATMRGAAGHAADRPLVAQPAE